MRTIVWVVAVLLIAAVWGNWTESGGSRPDRPDVLETTVTAYACGWVPYMTRDRAGTTIDGRGMALGGIVTFLIVLAARRAAAGRREAA